MQVGFTTYDLNKTKKKSLLDYFLIIYLTPFNKPTANS